MKDDSTHQKKSEHFWPDKTILIAEDMKVVQFFYKKLLESTQVNIIFAENGLEAIEKSHNNPQIKVILMDLSMPDMNGLEATKKIKEFNPNIPIIIQSANALTEDINKSKEAGADGHIAKPINTKELMEILERFLG